jgi:magnesium-protoporphyrin IX monomethyl ester (oxidative) cyclase
MPASNSVQCLRVLLVHPGPLMYSEIYLRLEPLGLERVAEAVRMAGHDVRIVDLQTFSHRELNDEIDAFRPQAIGFSLNYLANVPEVIDLAKAIKSKLPLSLIFIGGHSGSFIAEELLEHGNGAIDCVLRGEGELSTPMLLTAMVDGGIDAVPGAVTLRGSGPAPLLLETLDLHRPALDLLRRRNRYFIGELDPCASIEFTRGCPWDCAFCSAWTFYGRSYRTASPERIGEELASIREPNVFIVDDVAFIHPEHGFAIGKEIEKRGIRKRYYLETRADVLLKNREVFAYWKTLGLKYLFLGLEAIDAEGLKAHRKRVSMGTNTEALEVARKIGVSVAVNLIADPDWDEARFAIVREWALSIPDIVHLTVATPYPGTELWLTESRKLATRDYRLFDIQHAVLPTRLPLHKFYQELVETQRVIARKHLGLAVMRKAAGRMARLAMQGQTNFIRAIWKFNKVYNADRQFADHQKPVTYQIRPPVVTAPLSKEKAELYVHPKRKVRHTEDSAADSVEGSAA